MSTERLDRIIEEVKSLSPDDRRRLLERLETDEELSTVKTPVRRAGTLKGTVSIWLRILFKLNSPDIKRALTARL